MSASSSGRSPASGRSSGSFAARTLTAALPRARPSRTSFSEALGIRYAGPIDGHDVGAVEHALRNAAAFNGPIVLHVLTRKGKGYGPAEQDEIQCLHDYKASKTITPAQGH